MKLTGKLKDKVDKTESMVEKKDIIAEAGMELTDDELDMVTGGCDNSTLQAEELERQMKRNQKLKEKYEEQMKIIEESQKSFEEKYKLTPPLPPRF